LPYEVRIDSARRIVVAAATGTVEQGLAIGMVGEARKAAGLHGMNILYDLRAATPGDMSSGGLFWMPRQVQELQGAEARRVKVALLHPPQFAAIATYWETAFTNAGLKAKAFDDEDAAVAWLA
jgi:hypothetical protein